MQQCHDSMHCNTTINNNIYIQYNIYSNIMMRIKYNILIVSSVYQGWSLQLSKIASLVVSDTMSGALKSNACSTQLLFKTVATSSVDVVTTKRSLHA